MRQRTLAGTLAVTMLAVVALGSSPVDAQVDVLPGYIDDAGEPSISADGRWVVYAGRTGARRSVFRTDRERGITREIATVPTGVRGGDTVHPRLSADGCVVVALTEIPFDLFRDDDRGDRWDVYRLVLPECGGQENGWELVSANPLTGVALDDVDLDSPPTLSSSGAVIAYAHPVRGGPDGLTTISVVDVTRPSNDRERVTTVAGTPVEAPNRAFVYRGARQPALSQNGRHLAFVADFTASEPLPGWADGPVLGGEATSQVYVWDRGAPTLDRGVRLISGRDGRLSAAGGEWPTISEDGRVVAFVSRDRSIVSATLPDCTPACPSQVYRFDRDVDGNGIFDEPPRSNPLTIVSAVPTEFGLPVAGDRSSWSPTVSFDGSQVAFVTDATNLMPSRRGGGGDATDGDLLVAEFHLGELRRVIDDPSLTGIPGAHGRPALSKTGEVIVFDTMAAGPLTGIRRSASGRAIAAVTVTPRLSLASLDFGTVVFNLESAELYATVLNAGPAAFEPTSVTVSSRFRVTGGTCRRGIIVAAGQSCSVKLTFRPTGVRGYEGTLTVAGDGPGSPSVSATVRGATGEPTLITSPGGVDLPGGVVGELGGRIAVDVVNTGFVPTRVVRLDMGGTDPGDFRIVSESCTGRALNPDASCAVEVEFLPTAAGYRSALLLATAGRGSAATNGAYTASVIGGYARWEPTAWIEETSDGSAVGEASEGGEAPDFSDDGDDSDSGDDSDGGDGGDGGDGSVDGSVDGSIASVGDVLPGRTVVIRGSGFPPASTVTVGFADGSPPFAVVSSDEAGGLFAEVRIPVRARSGDRRLVVTSNDGAIATVDLTVASRPRLVVPGIPGYGLG